MAIAAVAARELFVELADTEKWIEIYFKYSYYLNTRMNTLGALFVPSERSPNGEPHWRIRADYLEMRRLVRYLGKDNIQFGDAVVAWGKREKGRHEELEKLLAANDAKLVNLPQKLPDLANILHDFQRGAVAFGVASHAPLIADQPGLGKTLEAIGVIFEGGTEVGPNLVVAPLTSLESVWEYELNRWQDYPVLCAAGAGVNRMRREAVLREAEIAHDADMPFFLLVGPEMVRMRKSTYNPDTDEVEMVSNFPWLHDMEWANLIIDECHKNALRDPNSVTSKGIKKLKLRSASDGVPAGKKIALSGTPLGGKAINLWGILNYLHPEVFGSKWRWVNQWLYAEKGRYGTMVGGVRPERQEEFDRHLAPYMIRRTKEQVLKELPPKDRHDLWVEMTPTQEKQYKAMAQDAMVQISDENISATSVLAIFTRLKQFAGAHQKFENGKLRATTDSGKLMAVMEKLEEIGILDEDGDQQVVIASQFESMVDMFYDHLTELKVPCLKLVGKVKGKQRTENIRNFQEGKDVRVMLMTTDTGGMSITLDRADNVIILDEKWNPDDQEQVEDRCHRASRIHQVTVWYVRTRKSIEEYIKQVTDAKGDINRIILDERLNIRLF